MLLLRKRWKAYRFFAETGFRGTGEPFNPHQTPPPTVARGCERYADLASPRAVFLARAAGARAIAQTHPRGQRTWGRTSVSTACEFSFFALSAEEHPPILPSAGRDCNALAKFFQEFRARLASVAA
jgi:hypothetical protein